MREKEKKNGEVKSISLLVLVMMTQASPHLHIQNKWNGYCAHITYMYFVASSERPAVLKPRVSLSRVVPTVCGLTTSWNNYAA